MAESTAAAPEQRNQPLKAALWMTGAIASFTLMAVSGRAAQAELNTFELMFWRSLIGFGMVLVILAASQGGMRQVATRVPGLHLVRNLFHFTGQNLWFYGIAAIPMAQLVALEFTLPIWVVLLSPLLLGEALTRRKLLVALAGFGGVLLIAQPGVQPLQAGHLAGLLAALGLAINVMLTKRIMRYDAVLCVLFWMTLLQTIFGLTLSVAGGFTWPGMATVPWLLVVGVTGLTAHFALTSALSHAPASIVAPMEFARLPIIALVGFWLYAEALDPLVFIGAAIILSANSFNFGGRKKGG